MFLIHLLYQCQILPSLPCRVGVGGESDEHGFTVTILKFPPDILVVKKKRNSHRILSFFTIDKHLINKFILDEIVLFSNFLLTKI